MTNIIFDIWIDFSDKRWLAYKDILIENHKKYAKLCGAEYKHYNIKHENKIDFKQLNFMKIYIAEDLAQIYDKVLYLDLDVIPKTKINFFEYHDFSNLLCHRTLAPLWKINIKRLMLESEGISSEHNVINTGVFGITKEVCNLIKFQKREKEINLEYLNEYGANNEIYLSYIVEKYKVPYTDIGTAWNFLVDKNYPKSDACHFLHMSTKEFNSVL